MIKKIQDKLTEILLKKGYIEEFLYFKSYHSYLFNIYYLPIVKRLGKYTFLFITSQCYG